MSAEAERIREAMRTRVICVCGHGYMQADVGTVCPNPYCARGRASDVLEVLELTPPMSQPDAVVLHGTRRLFQRMKAIIPGPRRQTVWLWEAKP